MQSATLGRYRILRELGRGAMGRVLLAHDPEIDRPVAIKTVEAFQGIPADHQAEARAAFLAEARSAGRLVHPGIVTVFDVGESDGTPWLAMEYLEGESLDRFTAPSSRLPLPTVLRMLAGAADALCHAHRSGVIHRDVKPANLARVGESAVKVMDFGLAGPAEAQRSGDGSRFGTPAYMSPEQVRGAPLDGRSDLFSLSVVLYELVTGTRPFGGESVSSILYRIVNEPPREIPADDATIPEPVREILRRGLAKSPADRFSDGAALAAALREAAGEESPGHGAAQPADPAGSGADVPGGADRPPPRRPVAPRSSPVPYVVGLAVLIAVVAGALLWLGREPDAASATASQSAPAPKPPAEPVWLEARVRTEPAGAEVLLDGKPLEADAGGFVRFQADGPLGLLTASRACRRTERRLTPDDDASDVVLVLEAAEARVPFDPGPGARVVLNGAAVGAAPIDLALDLCRDNRVEVAAAGYRPGVVDLPAGISLDDTRTRLAGFALAAIPRGLLRLPTFREVKLVYYVDGERVGDGVVEIPLDEGDHEIRFKNEALWLDAAIPLRIAGGETLEAPVKLPAVTELVVQAFPANCKVSLRRPGGKWQYVDDTPMRRKIAVGEYEVRVEQNVTGETRESRVTLKAGENPPVRVAFRGGQ